MNVDNYKTTLCALANFQSSQVSWNSLTGCDVNERKK